MARPYSTNFLYQIGTTKDVTLGVKLARAAVASNIPASYVAAAIGASRITVYAWYRGRPLREKYRKMVEAFIELLHQDTNAGRLPATSHADAKRYIEEMIDAKI